MTALGVAPRRRAIADAQSTPVLPPHARVQFDSVRGVYAVLAPERVYWPDGVSLDILRLCDGTRTVGEIADALSNEYAAPRETIETDVLEFVQSWTDIRLLRL